MAIKDRTFYPEHPSIAELIINLAELPHKTNRWRDDEKYAYRAVVTVESVMR